MPEWSTWDSNDSEAGGRGRGLFKSVSILGESGDEFSATAPRALHA